MMGFDFPQISIELLFDGCVNIKQQFAHNMLILCLYLVNTAPKGFSCFFNVKICCFSLFGTVCQTSYFQYLLTFYRLNN